jgi:hypothetical protein
LAATTLGVVAHGLGLLGYSATRVFDRVDDDPIRFPLWRI